MIALCRRTITFYYIMSYTATIQCAIRSSSLAIQNGVASGHRTLFVLVGDKGRDQVVNLHYMLSKASVKTRPSVLWCYKKDLGFTT